MKKKAGNILKGIVVMVHPELATDPVNCQGHIGKIITALGDGDVATVKFENGVTGKYSTDGLITLYPAVVILQVFKTNPELAKQSPGHHDRMTRIYRLVSDGHKKEALVLAMGTETTRFFCTTNCRDLLPMLKEAINNNRQCKKQ